MAGKQELALCYAPEAGAKVRKRKGVLVRLGVRIRNVLPEQIGETVGKLAGLKEYENPAPEDEAAKGLARAELETEAAEGENKPAGEAKSGSDETEAAEGENKPAGEAKSGSDENKAAGAKAAHAGIAADIAAEIPEDVLVLCNFDGAKLDRLLRELRKANASPELKAVLTETNAGWSFYQLYQELRKERDAVG